MGRTRDHDTVVIDHVLITISPELFATVGAGAIRGGTGVSFWVQDTSKRAGTMRRRIRIKRKIRDYCLNGKSVLSRKLIYAALVGYLFESYFHWVACGELQISLLITGLCTNAFIPFILSVVGLRFSTLYPGVSTWYGVVTGTDSRSVINCPRVIAIAWSRVILLRGLVVWVPHVLITMTRFPLIVWILFGHTCTSCVCISVW